MCPSEELFITLAHYVSFALVVVRTRSSTFPSSTITFHLSIFHLAVTTYYHRIHGQQDCLVVWPFKVRPQGVSPMPSLRSAVLMPPCLHPCLWKWMRGKASKCWLHHCSCRKERSKYILCENVISLQEFYVTLITLQAQGKQLRHTHSNGSRAETQEAHTRNISQVKEFEMNNKKLEFFVKCRA